MSEIPAHHEAARVASIRLATTPGTELLAQHAIRHDHSLNWFLDTGGEAQRAAAQEAWEREVPALRKREAYWKSKFRQGSIWGNLALAGLDDETAVTWPTLRMLEKQKYNSWGRHKSNLVAMVCGLPPRSAAASDRDDRIEAALRAMVRHADALIKVGTWQHFSELDQAKEALKR